MLPRHTYGKCKKRVILLNLLALLVLWPTQLKAAPNNGDIFKLKQPDGSYVEVKVWGDEFYQRVESLDGYTLVRDPQTRLICYAELSVDKSELNSTAIVYSEASVSSNGSLENQIMKFGIPKHLKLKRESILQKVAQARQELLGEGTGMAIQAQADLASTEVTGSILGLTLLIDFPDEPATMPKTEINNYLNQFGYSNYGNNGSVRDYFYVVSGSLLDYTNYVTEYYTAANNKDYYTDESIPYGLRARELVNEALVWLDGQGFDFSMLSTDSDGRILATNALYAGFADNAWAQGLWPHRGVLSPEFEADGVRSRNYQIYYIGNELRLRGFCHENGHLILDLRDLYDYGFESWGIGNYGLMATGGSNYNPVPPNPYYRNLVGWETVIDITNDEHSSVYYHTANSLTSYRYSHPSNPEEFFLIESRLQTDRNASLPDEGLMIWHIDESGSNNNEQMTPSLHYKVSVEQADGAFHLENNVNRGEPGDLFHAGYNDSFNDYTIPDTKWWSGLDSGLNINIGSIDTTMIFTTGSATATGFVWYVDDDAPNNPGSGTLDDPFKFLQDALFVALITDEIRVAQGIYTPAEPFGNREATFQLIDGIAIKGGYAGFGEPNPDARNIALYKTILSGDLNGNDGPNFSNNSDNSYHVATASGTDSTTILDGFTITGGNANGSGAYKCGGGMYNDSGSPMLVNCSFINNLATGNGKGGGIYNTNSSSPTITSCIFSGNAVQGSWAYGGGIYNTSSSSPNLTSCLFSDNSSGREGGGVYNRNISSPSLTNCTFYGNSAVVNGGGICNRDGDGSNPTLTSSILWDNSDSGGTDESAQILGSIPVINYSCIKGWTGVLGGIGNIGDNPLFVNTADGDYHLLWDSACINTGDPTLVFDSDKKDVDGEPRVMAGRVDMGADEVGEKQADFTRNGIIDMKDVLIFVQAWLSTPSDSNWYILCDLYEDDQINSPDWAELANNWLWQASWYNP